MYLLIVNYNTVPEAVAPHRPTHLAWIQQYIDAGIFLLVGPKKSQLGGVILAKSIDKQQLQAIIAEDSFVKFDVADYQIIDFDCKLVHPDFEKLKTL